MLFAVADKEDFENEENDTNGFLYCEEGCGSVKLIEAQSKEQAVKKYLSFSYDSTLSQNDTWLNDLIDETIMDDFIKCAVYGDSFFDQPEKDEKISDLANKVSYKVLTAYLHPVPAAGQKIPFRFRVLI